MTIGTRIIRAPRGSALSCKGWPQEATLRMLMNNPDHDETLIIQSGNPVGVCRAYRGAPRTPFANALLVPAWATWETFGDREDRGLTLYGQMTAGSWICIETRAFSQDTDKTSAGAALVAEIGRGRIARSIALEANVAEAPPEILQRDVIPDVVADQTSAHDALNRCVPHRMSLTEAAVPRERHPRQNVEHIERSMTSMARHVEAMLAFRARAAMTFDAGNSIRAQAQHAGVENAFDIQGFVPEYVRPLFCEGKGPFRWPALSEDPDDICVIDDAVLEMVSDARAGASETIVTGGV